MQKSKLYRAILSAAVLGSLLAGCGGTGQDDGSVSAEKKSFTGLVIDGYLARATVYLDSNNNGALDAWESWAFTDNDGYFSYNPKTSKNYCAAESTAEEKQFCLETGIDYTDIVLRIDKGYDVLTGEPFLGHLTRRIDASVETGLSTTIVSPLTSLFSAKMSSEHKQALLVALGITEAEMNVDYLNATGLDDVNPKLFSLALKVHKVVTVLSHRLSTTYSELGSHFSTPDDASSAIYPALASQLIGANKPVDEVLADPSVLLAALQISEAEIRAIYSDKDFDLPASLSAGSPEVLDRVAQVASGLPAIIDVLVNDQTLMTQARASGASRALESIVLKAVQENGGLDETLNNAFSFFNNEQNTALILGLIDSLAQPTADVSKLSQNDFSGEDFDSIEEIAAAALLADGSEPFGGIGGMQLRISELDLGTDTYLKDSEVEFYFAGSATDTSGSFVGCAKHINGATPDGKLDDGNTRGELVDGYWSMLGASSDNVQSYNLLITLTFLGATYQGILKPAGLETVDGIEYTRVRFDYDDDLNEWHTSAGLVPIVALPSNREECQMRLPSRVNI